MDRRMTGALLAAVAGFALAGCDHGPTGAEADGEGDVAVAFATTGPATAHTGGAGAARSVTVEGDDGTLVLDELHIIVEEFELKRVDDDGCAEEDDDCEKFRSAPAFVSVPLDGGRTVAATFDVEPGIYDELEFEVDDLDDDEEDPAEARQIARLLTRIRDRFPDWPRDASMLVVGTFSPTGGEPMPFRVYFEAEVEVDLRLSPPVTITGDDEATFTVRLDPAVWFTDGRGRVRNLARLDFDTAGRVVELEVEIEEGVVRVEFDD